MFVPTVLLLLDTVELTVLLTVELVTVSVAHTLEINSNDIGNPRYLSCIILLSSPYSFRHV